MQGQKQSIGIGFNAIDLRYSSELQNKTDQGGYKNIGKKEKLTWEGDKEWSKHHTYTVLWNRDTQLEC
jgi:hypothetical protein